MKLFLRIALVVIILPFPVWMTMAAMYAWRHFRKQSAVEVRS